jgi:hypothetical protein
LGQFLFRLFARGDVAHDAHVTLWFTEAAAHGEHGKIDRSFFAILAAANVFTVVVTLRDQLLQDLAERLPAQIDRRSFALEIRIGIAEQGKVRAVLLEIKTVRIDDGDRFLRVREYLAIKRGLQVDGTSDRAQRERIDAKILLET